MGLYLAPAAYCHVLSGRGYKQQNMHLSVFLFCSVLFSSVFTTLSVLGVATEFFFFLHILTSYFHNL